MKQRNQKDSRISRRNFIRSSVSATAGLGLIRGGRLLGQDGEEPPGPKIKEYRTLGRTGFKVSDIGFGTGNLSNPNVIEAALDMGINYIDTAEHYGHGNSERTIGQVISKRDRKKIFLTTKLNMMGGGSKEKLKARFIECLERLQTDYADCLMIHMVPTVEQVTHEGYHEAIQELKAEGKVRFTGLSNHGTEHKLAGPIKDEMDKIILAAAEDGRFDVVLFTYNFIQKEMGDRILKACKNKNMGTTLMKTNPVKFYQDMQDMLERNLEQGRKFGEQFYKIIDEYKTLIDQGEGFMKKYGLTSAEKTRDAAIKFCLSNPDVHSACSSMNSFEELETFVALSGTRLDPEEKAMLTDYKSKLGRYYCRHACGQCEGNCPQGVPVNTIMRYFHYFAAQGREKYAMEKYNALSRNTADACSNCTESYCEKACPYRVPVQGLLVLAHHTLTL
ncbi:MAG: aldo/keto reductase [Candidatus Aminicenantes bacterium]|nr:aldo/keto reductase [Candidatus Aminicenantes bacterium]